MKVINNYKLIKFYKFILIFTYILIIIIIKFYINKTNIEKNYWYNKFIFTNEMIKNYENLYSYNIYNVFKPNCTGYKIKYYTNKKIKGICICVVGKKENLYAKEFVEYYVNLKVDKIIVVDNNDIDGERFEDVLEYYILNNLVEIIDTRGISSIQMPIYNYVYKKYSPDYDWIAFIDFDEYIFINNNININNYLYNRRFEKCQVILLNWIFYSDNDLIEYDNRTLIERFTRKRFHLNRGKSIIRTGFNDVLIPTSMNPGINIKYFCNSKGKRIFPLDFFYREFTNDNLAFIKHFYTKTVKEFCNKITKGDIFFSQSNYNYNKSIDNKIKLFYAINKKTKEKEQIINKCKIY